MQTQQTYISEKIRNSSNAVINPATEETCSATYNLLADSARFDAFSRLRVSEPVSLFSVQCQYNSAPLIMESGNTGTGVLPAHSADDRMVKLRATAGSGTSFMQSYQYIPYQPIKSHLIAITGVFTAGVAGAVVDVGYFDSANGIILRQNGASGLQIVRRTSTSGLVVEEVVDQANWNLNTSTYFNEANSFIFIIDLQFLGMGRIRCGFDRDGIIEYFHEFLNANEMAVPYMQTATLPIQMLLTATATAGAKDCYFKCASVNSEGGIADDFAFSFSTDKYLGTAGNNARAHIISIRPKTTFNSITNREMFVLDSVDILVTGNNSIFWELVLGQAITSPAWADVNTTYSAFETSGGTISGSPGIVIGSGFATATATIKGAISKQTATRYPITLDRAGAVRSFGTLSLLATGLGATSTLQAVFNFREIR